MPWKKIAIVSSFAGVGAAIGLFVASEIFTSLFAGYSIAQLVIAELIVVFASVSSGQWAEYKFKR